MSNCIMTCSGKRPRDLLNPKAVKYMQYIFSIKDVVNKKECREISALFGVTATQVLFSFIKQPGLFFLEFLVRPGYRL